MKPMLPLITAFALLGCAPDETLTGYGAADHVWTLRQINGVPFDARATLTFPEPGKLSGQAPCNSFQGSQTAPYPWFKAENIASTRRACADLPAETTFLTTLATMTLAEVQGTTLLLSNDAGHDMLFRAMP